MSLLAAALISGGLSAAKGIFGAVQSARASKGLRNIQRPEYERPQEAGEMLDMFRQRASISQMPGQEGMESRMGAGVAQGVQDIQRTASSSVAAMGAITGLHGRRQDAIRDLGVQFAEYKSARQAELGQALGRAAEYSDKEFAMNKWQPYQVRMNELTSQKQAGAANMWGGMEGMGAAFSNLQGTQSYLDILKQMGAGGAGAGMLPPPPTQSPIGFHSPIKRTNNIQDINYG